VRYFDDLPIALGDIVEVPVPGGSARARVVMLGDTYEHLDIKPGFLDWVERDKVLRKNAIVIEWLSENPFAHDDPKYAPVGNYMFTDVDQFVVRVGSA
jgi:hypothetical protein